MANFQVATIRVGFNVVTPTDVIERRIHKAIIDHLNSKIVSIQGAITNQAQTLIRKALIESPETDSLISGTLREELGIEDPTDEVQNIISAIASTVSVNITPARRASGGINMKIRLTAVPIDLESVVGSLGSYVTRKGSSIPWFEWLTRLGDRVIVRDYGIEGGHPLVSRTGDKIMVHSQRKGWRVPPEYSGTATYNFVTRATDTILPELATFIESQVKRVL